MSAKHRIVIPPFSIQTPPEWSQKIPTAKQSFFSDGYDYNGEEKRLGEMLGDTNMINIFNIPKDNPEYDAVFSFVNHQILLKQYISRKRLYRFKTIMTDNGPIREQAIPLDQIDIFVSVDAKFDNIGKLRDTQQDYVLLHTKQAARAWEGKNNEDYPRARWPGIRYVISLTSELIRMTQNGHPFAHAALIDFEKRLSETSSFLKQETEKMQLLIDRINSSGIHIGVVENEKPVSIPLGYVRGYGFSLIQLLTAYDLYIRLAKTLMLKGILQNSVCNDIIREGGKKIRRLNQDLYLIAMRMRKIKNISRKDFLADENGNLGKRLQSAIYEGALSPIPQSVLNYQTVPEFVFLRPSFTREELDKMTEYAKQYGLLTETENM